MSNQELEQLADRLQKSDEYRIARKYQKPKGYNLDSDDNNSNCKRQNKLIGVFLDIEATGLLYTSDKLIELGMVKFEYTKDGRIFNLLEEFGSYQDPNIPIPAHITKLTGISDDMVKGHSIDESAVSEYLKGVDMIIAHNAQFDRDFFEISFPNITPKAWACSMRDVNWSEEDINSLKLEYIAYRYDFFFQGHRAITDCLVGIHILAQKLLISKTPVLKRLLDNAMELEFEIIAKDTPYESKDLLKTKGYRWGMPPANTHRASYVTVPEHRVEEEIKYLRSDIYESNTILPIKIEISDAFNKHSIINRSVESTNKKYADKLIWAKDLCKI